MDFDDTFYQQWKMQKINNRRLFTEKSKDDLPKSNQIFSSTTVEDQTETETFSLRLSESYVDETQESFEENKQKKTEVIVISDSSFDEVGSTEEKSCREINYTKPLDKIPQKICVIESSDDDLPNSQIQETLKKGFQSLHSAPKTLTEQICKKDIVIQESDSELEQSKLPEIIKDTIAESVTLSERKKKEILQWLSTNFDGSRCGSSCSTESAIADSRKSGISSGNSSLERLELNFETPNNRGKLSKPGTIKKANKDSLTDKQSRIDQYFSNKKKGQLQITRDNTPKSKNSDLVPSTYGDRRKIIPSKVRSITKTSSITESPHKKNNNEIKSIRKKNSIVSETSNSRSDGSDRVSVDSIKVNPINIIIPESQSFESDNSEKNIVKPTTVNAKHSQSRSPDNNLLKTSEENIFQSTSDSNSNNINLDNIDQNISVDNTINDCADILENLYGTIWRNKVNTLVAVSEPRKKITKQIFKKPGTEKKLKNRGPTFQDLPGKEFSDKENEHNPILRKVQTEKVNRNRRDKDDFINDDTTESSPDCSYYTAVSNPVPSQNNIFKKLPISKNNKNKITKKLIELCDSDSDSDDSNWKQRDLNQRKLSFDSSPSSSTSEFDPEDIVPPKNTKFKKSVNFPCAKQKVSHQTEKIPVRKSFLASLSKDVPLENADFKAMVYRVKYNSLKEELCNVLYKLFNEKVFDSKLPEDMSIEWSVRLRGTAGKCYNKQSLKALGKTVRSSRIVLATKILDSPDRLRDTLVHEMCHAATWLINNVSDGHGSFWKAWASKAMKVFPELPSISRCHNYEIQTKYTYKCTSCGYSIGRHSKSLDLNRKRCGYCHGTFELLINKVTKAGKVQKKSVAQTKGPSGFALYVKENYHSVKQKSTSMKHAEVMKVLGQQFSAVKLTPKPVDRVRNNEDESP